MPGIHCEKTKSNCKGDSYPLFVTMHFIPAALAAASPIALSSTTTQLQNQGKKKDMNE
jgi:hypothetical protein